MGNKTSKQLSVDVYKSKLLQINETITSKQNDEENKGIDIKWPNDILSVLISFCDRTTQCRLINATFTHLKSHKDALISTLSSIHIEPSISAYLITDFNNNKRNN